MKITLDTDLKAGTYTLVSDALPAPVDPPAVTPRPFHVDFTAERDADGHTVHFHNLSTGVGADFVRWAFGNGASSATPAEFVDYSYPKAGTYKTSLTAWNEAHTANAVVKLEVTTTVDAAVASPPPSVEPPGNLPAPPAPIIYPQDNSWTPESDLRAATAPGTHAARVTVVDGAGRAWSAQAMVGDDPTVAAKYVKLTDEDGHEHRGLTAWFYADCVEVGVTRIDCPYDELNCQLSVTYDGAEIPHAPSSYPDGHVDFWRGCRSAPIRYGNQVGWDASKIDKTLLPSYAYGETQVPWVGGSLSGDLTFNGLGIATTWGMGSGGERPDIGYMSQWNVGFILNPSDATWAIVRQADDHCGNWAPVYFSDPFTGSILNRLTVPQLTCFVPQSAVHGWPNNALIPYGGSYNGDTLIPPDVTAAGDAKRISACPNNPSNDHQTSYALLSAMVTGTARDRDHASFWCNYHLFFGNPLTTMEKGVTSWAPRGFAWGIRNIFLGAYVSAHTAYFEAELNHELEICTATVLNSNKYGIWDRYITYRGTPGTSAEGWLGTATWQQYYIMMSLDAIAFKRPEWVPLAKYLAKQAMLYFTKNYALCGPVSQSFIRDPNGNLPDTWEEILRISLISYFLMTDEEADALINANSVKDAYDIVVAYYARVGKPWAGKYENGIADLMVSPTSVDGHTIDFRAAVVAAYNLGVEGSDTALQYVQNLPTKPDFTKNQKYHFAPRTVA